MQGARVFREADVNATPFGATNSRVGQQQAGSSSTLSRREQAASEVERRKAEVAARKLEASKRSLDRQGQLPGTTTAKSKLNSSETAF